MKLKKNNWILVNIAALYILSAVWVVAERFIAALLDRYAPVEVFGFSYISNTSEAVIFGAVLAVAFGIAAAASEGRQRLAFRLMMSGRLCFCAFFVFYLLFSESGTILYVDLALALVYGGLEAAGFVLLALDTRLRASAVVAAAATVLVTAAETYQLLASLMIVGSGEVMFWINALALSGTAILFLSVIRGVVCGLYFILMKTSRIEPSPEDGGRETDKEIKNEQE